ncbi:hypothetical protein [Nocardia blacklockiae]|uniref:hypothetical protein n=1 Tax=Nocardia blacklockiae TaxID=480036 RepID=UPI0018952CA5|nr:hypothetical protein [Nocardia blacklockiae]MBF6176427.1 hypothetical protein [Nocardia blacklockiae]
MIRREHGRTVVRLPAARTDTPARHALRRPRPARHTLAPGRQPARVTVVRAGPGRHAAPTRRTGVRNRPAHAGLDNYDRLLLWFAGCLLSIRIALVGEQPIDET